MRFTTAAVKVLVALSFSSSPLSIVASFALHFLGSYALKTGAEIQPQGFEFVEPIVMQPAAFDVSQPLKDYVMALPPLATVMIGGMNVPNYADFNDEKATDKEKKAKEGRAERAGPEKNLSEESLFDIEWNDDDKNHPNLKFTFEGISNEDNFDLSNSAPVPPDPNGDVGYNHYVQMVNNAVAIYDKHGQPVLGPFQLGAIWDGFPIADCGKNNGDPIVLYDQLAGCWLLTQFTRDCGSGSTPCYNCIAISKTEDPTDVYYRYAYITQADPLNAPSGTVLPDYPKYGMWTDAYVLTTRDIANRPPYGQGDQFDVAISVYALEKEKMIQGDPNARAVQFILDRNVVPEYLIGLGLLPADIDGDHKPPKGAPIPVVGIMDRNDFFDAVANLNQFQSPFDGVNIWDLYVNWENPLDSSLPIWGSVASGLDYDTWYPCLGPDGRNCIPQPGVGPASYVDFLNFIIHQPLFRLAYRNFGHYEALVACKSVEARPPPVAGTTATAGMLWFEIHRQEFEEYKFGYNINQQGIHAPNDGVNRWMGSIAQDHEGNIALGYSVSNFHIFPGIRATGRLAHDELGEMTLGEINIAEGSGRQLTTLDLARWGDYTSMSVDPSDDCTFWYINQYYTADGDGTLFGAAWQTRIGVFSLAEGCDHSASSDYDDDDKYY